MVKGKQLQMIEPDLEIVKKGNSYDLMIDLSHCFFSMFKCGLAMLARHSQQGKSHVERRI